MSQEIQQEREGTKFEVCSLILFQVKILFYFILFCTNALFVRGIHFAKAHNVVLPLKKGETQMGNPKE